MRKSALVVAAMLAFALPGSSGAQQSLPDQAPPNPNEVLSDQRLKIVEHKLLVAGEKFRDAGADRHRAEEAFDFGRQTISDVRDAFAEVPQDERAPYIQAISRAEQALNNDDTGSGAEAMQELQETIRDLAAGSG